MRQAIKAIGIAAAFTVCAWAAGQAKGSTDTAELARPLVITDVVEMPSELQGMLVGVPKCDADGNVYFRYYDEQKKMKTGVHKVDSKGRKQAIFRLDSDPDFASGPGGLSDFYVSKDGDFYGLAWKFGGYYIVEFNKGGEVKSKIELDKTLVATFVGGLSGGNFLVAGMERGTPEHPTPTRPFTAIVDANGRIIKRIVAPDDKRIGDAADAGDIDYVSAPGHGNSAVSGGGLMIGSDGNAYLLRATSPPTITVISPGGETLRSFTVNPPDSSVRFSNVHIADNRIALFYWENDSRTALVRLVDYEGQVVGTYKSTALTPVFPCFSPEGTFTFMMMKHGHQDLVRVEAK
jgi:hypothetical protein